MNFATLSSSHAGNFSIFSFVHLNFPGEYVEISSMNLVRTLAELRRELERVNAAILALEDVLANPTPKTRRGRSMGAQERLAVSERMRRYWEAKRTMACEPPAISPDRSEIPTIAAGNDFGRMAGSDAGCAFSSQAG